VQIEDREILDLLNKQAFSEKGFQLLVNKYNQKLYWCIRRLVYDHNDAEDALQNTFMKVWSNIKKFRKDSGLYTWLYRIATNEALSLLKKSKRHRELSFEDASREINALSGNDPLYSGDTINDRLQAAILTLPPRQRIVFNMKYFDEMKYDEMSEVLETSTGALKASYHLATKKIEKYVLQD
jgi:RNA polymerase sigma-70 factor (ECF subfamily)